MINVIFDLACVQNSAEKSVTFPTRKGKKTHLHSDTFDFTEGRPIYENNICSQEGKLPNLRTDSLDQL